MKTSVGTVAAALLIAGCSTGQSASGPRGALPPGTATLNVDGRDVGSTYSVRCESIDWMTRINTTGLIAMISRAGKLTTEFVRLDRVNGFTGSYERGLQGEATVGMTGPTYQISGAAVGFNKSEPTRPRAETFSLSVSC